VERDCPASVLMTVAWIPTQVGHPDAARSLQRSANAPGVGKLEPGPELKLEFALELELEEGVLGRPPVHRSRSVSNLSATGMSAKAEEEEEEETEEEELFTSPVSTKRLKKVCVTSNLFAAMKANAPMQVPPALPPALSPIPGNTEPLHARIDVRAFSVDDCSKGRPHGVEEVSHGPSTPNSPK
jgi:hypothetical protein